MKKVNNMLDQLFPKNIPVIFLHAHPDDESFLSACLIQELTQKGRNVTVVYCSAKYKKDKSITKIRRIEAKNACELLGAKSLFLDFYDALYEEETLCFYKNPIEKIYHNLTLKIPKLKSQKYVVVSYDKNGGYGHKDHVKVHELGQYLKKLHSEISLFEITINRTRMQNWLSSSSSKLSSQKLPKTQFWSRNYGIPESKINYYFSGSKNEIIAKYNSLQEHKTQMSKTGFPLSLNLKEFREVLGIEYLLQY